MRPESLSRIAAEVTPRQESSADATQASLGAGRERVRKVLLTQGPLLVASPEHPSRRPGVTRGLEAPARPPTIPAKTDCRRRPAKGDDMRSIRVLSTVPEPLRRGCLLVGSPPPLHAARHFRDVWALLVRVAPFAPPRRRLALASQAPRGGSVEHPLRLSP